MGYFILGNEYEGRLGPAEAPTVLTTLLNVAEPLLLNAVVLSNRSTDPQTYILHLVVSGGTAGTGTQIIPDVTVPPNDNAVYQFADGIPVSKNDTLQHIASDVGINVTVVMSRRNR